LKIYLIVTKPLPQHLEKAKGRKEDEMEVRDKFQSMRGEGQLKYLNRRRGKTTLLHPLQFWFDIRALEFALSIFYEGDY
tara:strand:+ start:1689 stop:1925 length:237 start_codon:yes stop_codon:yes gene_type:complete